MKKMSFCSNTMFWKLILMLIVFMVSIAVMPLSAADKVEEKTGTKSKASVRADDQNELCKKVSMLIKNKTITRFALDSKAVPETPNTDSFLNTDVDGDNIFDKIIRSCGTSECRLEIELSGGGKIEFDNGLFFIIQFERQIYLLASETRELYANIQQPIFTLYSVNVKGVTKVCDSCAERR